MEPIRGRGSLVGGRFVQGDSARATWLESRDPARDDEPQFRVLADEALVDDAVEAARAAQLAWHTAGLDVRIAHLDRLKSVFKARSEVIAEAITREMGKPHREAVLEARSLAARIDLMVHEGLRRIETLRPEGQDAEARARPQGVVAVIGPYNYPAHLLNAHVIPALLSGNTVVMKPSEHCLLTGELYAACFLDAGLPLGVVNMVQGRGDVGRALVLHRDVDAVLFTGSYATGRAILQATLDQPHKLVALEMGGKNIAVVLEDADPHQALAAVLQGAFLTAGQRCTATSRVLVHRRIFDRFTDALVAATKELVPGDPWRDDVPFGPLANRPAFERFLRLRGNATALGLEALVPGETLPGGAFVTPSVHLLPPGASDPVGYLDEELFGPDLCIERIDDDEHAIARMRASSYGLSNAVFTARADRFERFFRETRSGLLNHNRSTNGASGKLPFGGVGRSGNQRPAGIDAMRYTTFPVAIMRAESGDAPVEDAFRDALGTGTSLLGIGLDRLLVRQRLESLLERYRIAVDDVRGPEVLVPLHALRPLRHGGQALDASLFVVRLGRAARVEAPYLVLEAPEGDAALLFEETLGALLESLARENPIHFAGYPTPAVQLPSGGAMPRSEALLRRMYQGSFVPREKKTPVIDLGRSEGAFLRSVDEEPLVVLDAASQIATLGMGMQPGIFLRALDEGDLGDHLLANVDTTAVGVRVRELDELRAFLIERAWPQIRFASFTSGGATANEKAFDLCRLHGPGGHRVLAFEGSFHGRTLMALHATWNREKRAPFEHKGYEATFLPFPRWGDPREEPPCDASWISSWRRGEAPQGDNDPLLRAEIESLLRLRSEVERGNVCAVIVEPMQGEGGDNYATARFFQGLRALTRHLGVPLIVDEVQTGFGLAGTFYWHQRFQLRDEHGAPDGPDCITLAKKAQLGVCLSVWEDPRPSPAHVAQAIRGHYHGYAIVELSPRELESLVRDQLWNLAVDYPSLVLNPRNQGWAFAFDLPTPHLAQQVLAQRFYRGFMAYIAGEETVRFRLNAAWTARELKLLFSGIRACLDTLVDSACDAAEGEELLSMASFNAPAWEDWAVARRDESRRRFPGEYERLSADGPGLLSWLLALPRGPLERVCDRVLAREGQCSDEKLDHAIRALTRTRSRPPGTSVILERLRQIEEEIERSADPKGAYQKQDARLGMGPAQLVIESIGARLHRLASAEWTQVKGEVMAIEADTYEEGRRDSEEDLRRMLQGEGGVGLVLRRRTDHGDRILGYAFGGPVESYDADGPREDPMRGRGNTFYSSNITVAANERGGGLGLRLKRAQVRLVASMQNDDGSPKYLYMTGRNRVGHTRQMAGINRAFGAYPVEHFRGNQYGDRSGEALYYRIPLRRPHVEAASAARGPHSTEAPSLIDWASGIEAPLGAAPQRLLAAVRRGEFTGAVGTKLTLSNFITADVVRYTELLRQVAPRGLPHAYFTSGRDELVDKGLRCLRLGRPKADLVLGLERQYVGVTTAAARSLSDGSDQQQPFAWFDWPKVPHPAEVGVAASLDSLRMTLGDVTPERVLAVVVELVGEKTGYPLPQGYFEGLCTIRSSTGVPIVVVETASALGRLDGQIFASDGLPGRPNMVWWYCGGQLGHIFCDDTTWVDKPLQLISTWDGDEISLLRTRYHLLQAIEGARPGHYRGFEEALFETLRGRASLTGRGLIYGLDLGTHSRREQLLELALRHGLRLGRGLASKAMVLPPIDLAPDEQQEGLARLSRALEELS